MKNDRRLWLKALAASPLLLAQPAVADEDGLAAETDEKGGDGGAEMAEGMFHNVSLLGYGLLPLWLGFCKPCARPSAPTGQRRAGRRRRRKNKLHLTDQHWHGLC